MKTYSDELTPLPSSTPLYEGANWYEREVGVISQSLRFTCFQFTLEVSAGFMLPSKTSAAADYSIIELVNVYE